MHKSTLKEQEVVAFPVVPSSDFAVKQQPFVLLSRSCHGHEGFWQTWFVIGLSIMHRLINGSIFVTLSSIEDQVEGIF